MIQLKTVQKRLILSRLLRYCSSEQSRLSVEYRVRSDNTGQLAPAWLGCNLHPGPGCRTLRALRDPESLHWPLLITLDIMTHALSLSWPRHEVLTTVPAP